MAGRPAPLAAQVAQRETRDNTNLWLTVNGEYEVRPRWFADYELNLRFSGPLEEQMQFIPRLSVRYQARPSLRFNAGYNFAETWPYGAHPAPLRFPEHRTWQQLQYAHPLARLVVSHRYRLEQRWTGRNVQGNTFDQHRLIWLVGRRPPGGMRMETGYMQQVVLRGNERAVERNHTIVVTVFPSRLLAPAAPAAPAAPR